MRSQVGLTCSGVERENHANTSLFVSSKGIHSFHSMHEDGQWQVRVSLETPESQKTPPKKRADLRDGVKKETYLGTSGTLFFVFKLKRIDKSTGPMHTWVQSRVLGIVRAQKEAGDRAG